MIRLYSVTIHVAFPYLHMTNVCIDDVNEMFGARGGRVERVEKQLSTRAKC
jgi:transcription antitermination factor NusA-like protein